MKNTFIKPNDDLGILKIVGIILWIAVIAVFLYV